MGDLLRVGNNIIYIYQKRRYSLVFFMQALLRIAPAVQTAFWVEVIEVHCIVEPSILGHHRVQTVTSTSNNHGTLCYLQRDQV